MATNFGMYENIVPLLAPADQTTTTPVLGGYVDLKTANRASILVYFGVVTSSTATDTATVTLEASSASTSNASEEAVTFSYRIADPVATGNTWGAVTAATSAGVSMGASTAFDGKAILIDVDPQAIVAAKPLARYVRAVITEGEGAYSAMNVAMVAFVEPRYRQTTMVTVTVT